MRKKINKKSELKRQKLVQETFTAICESFVSDFMAHNFSADDENVLNSFDKHNTKWKDFARSIINKNLHAYDTRDKRERFILTFEKFVDNLLKKYENNQVTDLPKGKDTDNILIPCDCETKCETCDGFQPKEDPGDMVVKEPIECKPDGTEHELKSEGCVNYEQDINDWTDYEPTYIRATLQALGISTKANTIKGLTTVVNKLSDEQMKSFRSKLGLS